MTKAVAQHLHGVADVLPANMISAQCSNRSIQSFAALTSNYKSAPSFNM
jgi:hypothetical protein